MKNDGSENTNTEDAIETDKTDETNDSENVEICPKELDMLRKKAEELEKLKSERESMKTDFQEMKDMFDKIKTEREEELESKRQEKIKQLVNDFNIPEDELKEDSMEELLKTERRFDMAMKKNNEVEDENDISEDMDEIEDMSEKFKDLYFMQV